MNPALADRVKESTTSIGTGAITLAGAATGFRTFVGAIGNAIPLFYAIVHRTLGEWEVGIGTVTGNTSLARTTVLASSSGALVNFSAGTKDVFSTIPAGALDMVGWIGTGQGRLVYVSSTQIAFRPFNGRYLPVKDPSGWRNRSIGAGIVSGSPAGAVRVNGVASQALAADTTYLVTVLDVAGALEFDFLTNLAHEADVATGVEIAQANDSHTVVGMVHAITGPAFADSITQKLVASWFNRRTRRAQTELTADRQIASTNIWQEIHAELRCYVLTWDEALLINFSGGMWSQVNTGTCQAGVAIDDLATPLAESVQTSISQVDRGHAVGIGIALAPAEGYHVVSGLGRTYAPTILFSGQTGTNTSAKCRLSVAARI